MLLSELRNTLAKIDEIATLTLQARHANGVGCVSPLRDSLDDVKDDLEWLRVRCVAQLDLKAERNHVMVLLAALGGSAPL
jgi:hypothetical protein